jgi:hypothetical protein
VQTGVLRGPKTQYRTCPVLAEAVARRCVFGLLICTCIVKRRVCLWRWCFAAVILRRGGELLCFRESQSLCVSTGLALNSRCEEWVKSTHLTGCSTR